MNKPCPECNGTGWINDHRYVCPECEGLGRMCSVCDRSFSDCECEVFDEGDDVNRN